MHSFGLPVPDPEKLEIFQHKREKNIFVLKSWLFSLEGKKLLLQL
jgi:hypothetical protein